MAALTLCAGGCDDNGCCYLDESTSRGGLADCRCIDLLASDALELLKEQDKLVNLDKLREKLGFAESCEKCKKDSWRCQRDTYFTEMDFCNRLDIAIEELTQEGR